MANGMIPPWLTGADPVSAYAKGVALGSQMAAEVQHNQLAAQQMQARAVENERQRMIDQANAEMKFAYEQARLGMEQRQLDQKAQHDAAMLAMNEQFKQAQIGQMQNNALVAASRLAMEQNRLGISQQQLGLSQERLDYLKTKEPELPSTEKSAMVEKRRELLQLQKELRDLEQQKLSGKSKTLQTIPLIGKVRSSYDEDIQAKQKEINDLVEEMTVVYGEKAVPKMAVQPQELPTKVAEKEQAEPTPTAEPKKLTEEIAEEFFSRTNPELPREKRIRQAKAMALAAGYSEE